MAREFNFDGLVGPTHHYGGLSSGNLASEGNASAISNPKQAALQGLAKMNALAQRGFAQAVLPPLAAPDFDLLRALGFGGSEAQMLAQAYREASAVLSCAWSASAMWTANAATVSPSADTLDGRVHFTPANLCSKLHRAFEHPRTARALRAIFHDERHFVVHDALPACAALGDEGAANHTRFCGGYGAPGVEFFVYGRSEFGAGPAPTRYIARQTLEASRSVARLHGLREHDCVFAQQTPAAIDSGVFHNDVIAVGNGNLLFYHEHAFINEAEVLAELRGQLAQKGVAFQALRVSDDDLGMVDAVQSYLFNSQILTRAEGGMTLVAPEECLKNPRVAAYVQTLAQRGSAIDEVLFFDLQQSMKNGGGPACLRLRVVLNDAEASAVHPGVVLSDALYARLVAWVEKHYRDRLELRDLTDPKLVDEVRTALEALAQILDLSGLYRGCSQNGVGAWMPRRGCIMHNIHSDRCQINAQQTQ